MRIIADKPVELFRSLVSEHLIRVYPLGGPQWMHDDSLPVTDPSDYVIIPSDLRTGTIPPSSDPASWESVALNALNERIVLNGPEGSGVRFEVVAAIGPDFPDTPMLLLLTSDGTVVLATQSDAAIHPDGVIQISGAEASVILLTVDQFRAQRRMKLMRDGSFVRSFSVERRTDGLWVPVPFKFNLNAIAMRELDPSSGG